MERSRLLEVLVDWNFWEKELPTGFIRDRYIEKIKNLSKTGFVIALVGPRRTGKSTILFQYLKMLIEKGVNPKDTLLVNFEDYRFSEHSSELLEKIYNLYLEQIHQNSKPTIIFDEIQKVPQWERFVRTLYDKKTANIIVSSSSAKILSPELASLLTGRYLEITVLPLSFEEFLQFKGLKIDNEVTAIAQRNKITKLLNEYLEYGGFPEVVLNQAKIEILRRYYEDIVTKDIVNRYNIRSTAKINSIAHFYLTNNSKPITFGRIKRFLNMPLRTVERFSSYLETAYLIFFIKRYHPSLKEQEKAPRKVYAADQGLANAVGFKSSENYGRNMENVVFLGLKRRQLEEPDMEIFYWTDYSGNEVDFVIKRGSKITNLIQVCYDIENAETYEREHSGLLKAMEVFKLNSGIIITFDLEKEEKIKRKKIKYIPLWKWLLGFSNKI
jgi:predicted AAA+ superfamily ATPase